jgi:hypothetical protein
VDVPSKKNEIYSVAISVLDKAAIKDEAFITGERLKNPGAYDAFYAIISVITNIWIASSVHKLY